MKHLLFAALAASLLTGCSETREHGSNWSTTVRPFDTGDSYGSGQRGTRYDPPTAGRGGVHTTRPQTPN